LLAVGPRGGKELLCAVQIIPGSFDQFFFVGIILNQLFERGRGLSIVLLAVIADAKAIFGLGGGGFAGFGFGDDLAVGGHGGIEVAFGFLSVDGLFEGIGG